MISAETAASVNRFAAKHSDRIIYVLVALALLIPYVSDIRLPPAPMAAANDTFATIDALKPEPGKIVVIAADFGPGTFGENRPQAELAIEHLMRKRIPFALMSLYQLASPTLKELPLKVAARLQEQNPGESWVYGKDWVNFGYQANGGLALQSFGRATDIREVQASDAFGIPLSELAVMEGVRTIRDVRLLIHITGLVGVFNTWLQFFRTEGYSPPMLHGCTSISIPDAYIYYSSKQILGFFEGIGGAAWYDKMMTDKFGERPDVAKGVNTGLAFAQLIILFLILVGNIVHFARRRKT